MNVKPVVLITGCSGGIGYALAEAFHARSCITYATARKPESLAALAVQGIQLLALDVTDAGSIAAAVSAVEERHGAVDVLVNNAGIPVMGPTAELPLDELRLQWETNLIAPVAMVQAVVPAMAARGSGRIVNVGSVSGLLATPFAGPYCASKAALHSLNDALRMELKPFGIEVLLVQPGAIQSGFGVRAKAQTGRQTWRLYAGFTAAIAKRAGASQEHAMPTAAFAAALVRAVLADRPRAVIRLGTGSVILPRLARLPVPVKDWLLMRRFGLSGAPGQARKPD
jgi:NAD(P)-dependent dehydrogenase (short-subunit alcohol dehydrogenase family)